MNRWLIYILLLAGVACQPEDRAEQMPTLFRSMPSSETGIDFENLLKVSNDFDVFRYRNFYNGGGVAIGDINNDGLSDVFFTSNMDDNKLFLNKGNWKFEDISEKAGIKGKRFWATGVSMADVNGDGLLDIYVCNSGDIRGDNRANELFINHGDLTFRDEAADYGLADKGFSVHAAFFDFDKDGDLDCFVLNNSFRPVSSLGYRNLRNERDPLGGHKLFRNDNGKFTDVSMAAGIFGSVIGFGLGVTVGDINQDQWPDLYVSNDFYERDYLYINNHDGTFSERLPDFIGHLSMFSMGADMADINNDGYPEIFSTDMLPEDDRRLKTITAFEDYDVYQLRLKNGYYHQFIQNMLQLNNKDGTFSEIAQLAGVASTDWSWGALIADFDNDSRKEIFVSNGIYKDITNLDFVEFLGGGSQVREALEGREVNFKEMVDRLPSNKLSNYLFVRDSSLHFTNQSHAYGLDEPSFSNGAAYGDLDNDGDLDLVVNNVNQKCFVYQNQSETLRRNNQLTFIFKGERKNSFGIGAIVRVYVDKEILYNENIPIRGFQSSMDGKMIVGLGQTSFADSVVVEWPDGKRQTLVHVAANQRIVLDQSKATKASASHHDEVPALLVETRDSSIRHVENQFNDFDRDRLQYSMLSTQGPGFAKADLTGDGLDDFYLGGSLGNPGTLMIQQQDGSFKKVSLGASGLADETAAVFTDIDGDQDLDLYVVTGGSELPAGNAALEDHLYENRGIRAGVPEFVLTKGKLPRIFESGSCVRPADADGDGDLDLFIGTRMQPSRYGIPSDQYLLMNDGHGNFSQAAASWSEPLKKVGMVTDAQWFDYDQNGFPDLLIAGEWMGITLFTNDGRSLTKQESIKGIDHTEGWWNRIVPGDIDGDGDIDFVLGNQGLNSKFKPTATSPISLYNNDFDKDGTTEPIFAFRKDGKDFPFAFRQDLIKQVNSLKKKFVYYEDFAGKSLEEIFDKESIQSSVVLHFVEARTGVLMNLGNGGFHFIPLPTEAQFAPVYGLALQDLNRDGKQDIVLGGNFFANKPFAGRLDALHGLVLTGDGSGHFMPINSLASGFRLDGEIRHLDFLKTPSGPLLTAIRNNLPVRFFRMKQ